MHEKGPGTANAAKEVGCIRKAFDGYMESAKARALKRKAERKGGGRLLHGIWENRIGEKAFGAGK